MKAYIASIDPVGNTATTIATGTPVDIFKAIIAIGSTGKTDPNNQNYQSMMGALEQFLVDQSLIGLSVLETIDILLTSFEESGDAFLDEMIDLIGPDLTDDVNDFLRTLRKLFSGEIEDLSEMTEEYTLLVAVMSID